MKDVKGVDGTPQFLVPVGETKKLKDSKIESYVNKADLLARR
jgi:hypothetical protein